MKKTLSILLLIVFTYSFMGTWLNFAIEQYRIKEEIKEKIISRLPENELTLIKITSQDKEKIRWTDEGKEFNYAGSMFDIVKVKVKKNITYYYCFNDAKETDLFANLDQLVKDQKDNSKSKQNEKKEITYFTPEILLTQQLTARPVHYFCFSTGYKSFVRDVLSPPPRIVNLV
jgi:hypothetical protein